VAAEGAGSWRDIIGENPVAALAFQLEAGVLDDLVGLRREADDESRAIVAALRDAGEYIRVLGKTEHRRATSVLFQLVEGGALNPPVGDGRRHHRHVYRERGFAGGEHFRRGLDRHELDPG